MPQSRVYSLAALLLLVGLAIWIGHPILTPAQIGGHSSLIDLPRAVAYHDQARQGQWLPRWMPAFYLGHGSPLFLYYAPASYVFTEIVHSLFDETSTALKISYLLLVMLSLAGMFALGKRLAGILGGMAAAAMYGLAPYYLVDLFVRHGIAEFACFAILPWLFLALIGASETGDGFRWATMSILLALLVCTHNITALVTAPIVATIVLTLAKGLYRLIGLFHYGLGIGLSAWFWLPALGEKNLVQSTESLTGGDFHYSLHFVHPIQLLQTSWGFGVSGGNSPDRMSHQIGLALVAVVIATVAVLIRQRKRIDKRLRSVAMLFLGSFAICVLFTTAATKVFWDHLPLLPFVQFPWRFLLPVSFCGAACAAVLTAMITNGDGGFFPRFRKEVVVATMIIAATATTVTYVDARYLLLDVRDMTMVFFASPDDALAAELQFKELANPGDLYDINNLRIMRTTTTAQDDYLPMTVSRKPRRNGGYIAEPAGPGVIIVEKGLAGADYIFRYEAKQESVVRVEPFFFPGWNAVMNGSALPIFPEMDTGLLMVRVPAGEGEVFVRFGDTKIRTAGKWISGIALLMLPVSVLLLRRRTGGDGIARA